MASSSHWEGEWNVALVSAEPAPSETDLTVLIPAYSALLYRVAHSILRNPAEAEDVVQDVFLRVLQHDRKAHQRKLYEIRDLRVWLIRIAWNLALDRRRRIRPDQLDQPLADALLSTNAPADQALVGARHIAAVFREIDRLPKSERHALLLSAIDELSIAEISAVLHRSESAIRALLFRARTRLRQRIGKGNRS